VGVVASGRTGGLTGTVRTSFRRTAATAQISQSATSPPITTISVRRRRFVHGAGPISAAIPIAPYPPRAGPDHGGQRAIGTSAGCRTAPPMV
jgi:hypothetical protein